MNTQTAPVSSQSKEFDNVKRLPILISMIIGAFFTILNETLLNVAFPQLMVELNVTASTLQWLSTGYMLVVAVLIPASALLVQWFTTRQVFIGAMVIFYFRYTCKCDCAWIFYTINGSLVTSSRYGINNARINEYDSPSISS